MQKSPQKSDDLLDKATEIAISASKPKEQGRGRVEPVVDKSTINNLLEYLQSRRDIRELIAYIMRQTGREEIDTNTGKLLISNLLEIEKSNTEDKFEKAANLLGYVKWLHESLTSLPIKWDDIKSVKTFKELAEKLSKAM